MRVRFCLICVKTVTPLPFHWQPLFPLRAWAVTSLLRRGCAPEPWAKAKLKFWREEVLRRGVSSHPPPCPGSPDGDGQGEPLLRLQRARRTQGRPTNPLILVLKDPCAPQTGGSVRIHHPATPETSGVHCSRRTLAKVLRSAVPCKAGQTAGVSPRLQELRSSPESSYNEDVVPVLHWPILQSQAEMTTVKAPQWEEITCLLLWAGWT